MSNSKNDIQAIVNKYMSANLHIKHYNKLNQLNTINAFPWDMQKKINTEFFVPTYNNITLYYKDVGLETRDRDDGNKNYHKGDRGEHRGEHHHKGDRGEHRGEHHHKGDRGEQRGEYHRKGDRGEHREHRGEYHRKGDRGNSRDHIDPKISKKGGNRICQKTTVYFI